MKSARGKTSWNVRDYVYIGVGAALLLASSALFYILSFLYVTPFFFLADFTWSFPHAIILVLLFLIIRKFPVWTYLSVTEGVLSCVLLGWSFIWLPLYFVQGIAPDLFLKATRGYNNTRLRHCIIAIIIYEAISLSLTWFTFIYVLKTLYPPYVIAGSTASCTFWLILGAYTAYRMYPRVSVKLSAL